MNTRLVNIYALVNPLSNIPFYVGATIVKLPHRLYGHCSQPQYKLGNGVVKKKYDYISQLLSIGLKPEIRLLEQIDISEAQECEIKHYINLISKGYTLIQSEKQFSYSTQPKIKLYMEDALVKDSNKVNK